MMKRRLFTGNRKSHWLFGLLSACAVGSIIIFSMLKNNSGYEFVSSHISVRKPEDGLEELHPELAQQYNTLVEFVKRNKESRGVLVKYFSSLSRVDLTNKRYNNLHWNIGRAKTLSGRPLLTESDGAIWIVATRNSNDQIVLELTYGEPEVNLLRKQFGSMSN